MEIPEGHSAFEIDGITCRIKDHIEPGTCVSLYVWNYSWWQERENWLSICYIERLHDGDYAMYSIDNHPLGGGDNLSELIARRVREWGTAMGKI